MRRKLILAAIVIGALTLLLITFRGITFYRWIHLPNTTATGDPVIVLVPTNSSFNSLLDSLTLNGALTNVKTFRWVAGKMKFGDQNVKPGRYLIENGLNNRQLIHKLRLGDQYPVQLIINTSNSIGVLAAKVSAQVEPDSAAIANYILRSYLPESGFEMENILTLFIPNTYEVYWNITPEEFVSRMEIEHERFWNGDRLARASALSLNPQEVYTLASIIEKETHIDSERRNISSVYHNRLRRGIPLQADPTVLFAIGDTSVRRVLYTHLESDSPYNTYKIKGLPPGPIAMPSMSSLTAALSPSDTDYLYFCAKPGATGHVFARTLTEHNRNARAYQQWLNSVRN